MDNDFEKGFTQSVENSAVQEVVAVAPKTDDSKKHIYIYVALGAVIAVLLIVVVIMGVQLGQKSEDLEFYTEMYDDGSDDVDDRDDEIAEEDIEDIKAVMGCTYSGERYIGFYNDNTYSMIELSEYEELEGGTYSTDWSASITLTPEDGEGRVAALSGGNLTDNGLTFECKKYGGV